MDNQTTNLPGSDDKETIKEYLRLREHLSKGQYDRLVASVAIAIQRARENRAPQEVVIKITDKGYPRFIDPTDNHGPIE